MRKQWKLYVFFALLYLVCLGMVSTAGALTCSTHWVECDNPGTCDFCGTTGLEVPVEEMHHTNYIYVDIGAEHQHQCACGYEVRWTGEHVANCDTPTICRTCGLEITNPVNITVYHNYEYSNLGDTHQYACTGCGKVAEEAGRHFGYCTDPLVCVFCAATVADATMIDIYHDYVFVNLGDTHKGTCSQCGDISYDTEHWSVCTNPAVCDTCGGTMDPADTYHDFRYTNLGGTHQAECSNCGLKQAAEEHRVFCTAPGTCETCGASGLEVNYHRGSYVNLGAQHQFTCSSCGHVNAPQDHYVKCDDKTKCYRCEVAMGNVTDEQIWHQSIYWGSDENGCWQYCNDCGLKAKSEPHVTTCDAPATCYYCGKTGLTGVEPWHWGPYNNAVAQTSGHSYDCGKCGAHVDNEVHDYRDGVCSQCGHKESAAPARTPGDADGDGAVNVMDALAILQYDVGWGTAINTANSDVDGDGAVNVMDALLILQYDVGWDVELK